MSIDEKQLTDILTEVQSELDTMMKSELASLAKARPGEETTGESDSDSSATDPSGDNTSAASESPDAASASPDAAGSDSASPAPDASASGPADGSAPASADGSAPADPAQEAGPIDPQALMAEYAKLPPEDLKMHYLACKEALVQVLGAAGADDGSAPPAPGADASAAAGAPAPGSAPAGSPPPDAAGPALKSEKGMAGQKPGDSATSAPDGMKDDPKANGENPLHKSEKDFQAAVAVEVEKAVEPLVKAVKMIVEAPLSKAVRFTADMPATGGPDVSKMSREQVRAKLGEKVREGTLSKSDKDLVIAFDTGKVKADAVAHLLK